MTCQFNMIFSGIFEDLLCKNYRRRSCHLATRVVGAPPPSGRPLPRGPTVALLHLSFHPHTPSSSHKHEYPVHTRVRAHFVAIFDILAQSTSHKTAWGIVPWYVTPPLIQLVFAVVVYSLLILLLLVTMKMSLHVEFTWF